MKKGAIDYFTQTDLRQADLAQILRRVVEIRDLVNQNMELRQVNQMKNEFIANVSHELRTPLTVVIGYANTMRDGSLGPLSEPQAKAIGAIIDRAEGLLATLNNILLIREVHEGTKQLLLKPTDLGRLVAAQVERAGKEIRRKKLKLASTLTKEEVWVMADEEKLADVVDNLLSNATKFSPPEGPLRVSLGVDKGRACLAIEDAGPGVPPETMPHIFDAFFAAGQGPTREYPGLGLGLPLSKQIVESLSGHIWLDSRGAGKGTVAHMDLPLCAKDSAPRIIEGSETIRKKRVLIVEDNPDLVEVLMLFLSSVSRNLSISTAHSGFEALEKIKEETPHLVILDVMMPGMDGFEVLARLKNLPKEQRPPVMVLTGYTDALARVKAAGANEVMLKPFEKNAFVKKVLQLLESSASGG
ncbi:MAG: hybrid sensor histidine kinase/response regulator, partial [Elusimicrobia bacterium]|nr:hybrid sensor histidine kinase/response regulator [Elusimicrobiota bacterium]